MPAMAMRELDVLLFRKKRVIRTHATSGAKNAIQIKCGSIIIFKINGFPLSRE
jgi:hypothetical protein